MARITNKMRVDDAFLLIVYYESKILEAMNEVDYFVEKLNNVRNSCNYWSARIRK